MPHRAARLDADKRSMITGGVGFTGTNLAARLHNHQDETNDLAACGELRRVLRPGGVLLIGRPAGNRLRADRDAGVHTRHHSTRRDITDQRTAAAFWVEHANPANAPLLPSAAVSRFALPWGPSVMRVGRRRDGAERPAVFRPRVSTRRSSGTPASIVP